MAIDFKCPNCSSVLRVGDEFAGKPAKCPSCQQVSTIPPSAASQVPDPALGALGGGAQPTNSFGDGATEGQTNPFAPPGTIPPTPSYSGLGQPRAVDFGSIFNYAYQVWQGNLGILVGATAIMFAITIAFNIASGIVSSVLMENGDEVIGLIFNLGSSFFGQFIQTFLGIGMVRIALSLARRKPAEVSMLFSGTDVFLPVMLTSIVFGLATFIGFLLLIAPGVLLLLYFWPYHYFIVDKQAGMVDSFSRGYEIAKLNVGTSFVMGLVSFGIMILGFIALCVGVLFAAPLVAVIFASGYLLMKGEITG